MSQWDETSDLVVVGSGGASMCVGLLYKTLGRKALILEKQSKVGGSTGYSGGVWWIPNNSVMKRAGVEDSFEKAWQYFESAVKYRGKGSSDLLSFPGTDEQRRIGPLTTRRYGTDRLVTRRGGQLPQLVESVLCGCGSTAPDSDADKQGAVGPLCAPGFNLEDGQLAGSVLMLTGRAGTTVEMACL